MGHSQAADSLVDRRGCEADAATDYLQLTVATHVGESVLRGDTVDIPVHYDVLGRAWADDDEHWHFAAERLTDTLVLHVLPSAQPPIVCDYYPSNHIGRSQLSEKVPRMDDSSKKALEQAMPTTDTR